MDRIIQAAYAEYNYEDDFGNIEFNAHDMVGGNFENFYRYVSYPGNHPYLDCYERK